MGKILLILVTGLLTICGYAQPPQTYYTVNNGAWSSPSTWSNGVVPSTTLEHNATVVISHTINYDMPNDIVVEKGELRIPGGALYFPSVGTGSGRSIFIEQQGRLYIFNGELIMPITSGSSGNLKIEKGKVDIISSEVSIAQNWQNIQDHLEIILSCIRIGENYQSDHSHEIIDRSCLEIGLQGSGNFDNDRGNIKVFRASFLLRGQSGNFNNKNHQSKIEHHGSSNGIGILVLDVPGNLENNGLWKALVEQYCVDGNIQGSDADEIDFMNPENCPYVNAQSCHNCEGIEESPLPVNLISFNAVAFSNNHRLTWKVSDEIDLAHYDVERSTDGRNFSTIGIVTATTSTQYNFSSAAIPGTVYYRLKMMDIDGSHEYSRIIRLNSRQSNFLDVSPNPFRNQILMNLNIVNEATYGFKLVDAMGKLIRQKQERLNRGMHSIGWNNLDNLTPGMYSLIITEPRGNFIHIEKIIKQ